MTNMAKLALQEIPPSPDLPERVLQEWSAAVTAKKRGKPPRLFQCEPLFGGPACDYLVLINIGRGSRRLTCTAFVYNGAYPRASELGDLWVTPNFRYRVTDEDLRALAY